MYLVRASGTATHPKRVGEIPSKDNWVAGMIDAVDDALIQYYRDHTDVFTVVSNHGQSPSGLEVVSGLTAIDNCIDGVTHYTVFTLVDVAQAVVNGVEYQSTKLFNFPDGVIRIVGAHASLAQKTTSDLTSTLNASKTGAISAGTAAASSTTLDSTAADILPSTAFTSSATQNVAGTAVKPLLSASAQLDGRTTAKDLYLNTAYATTGDVDADATQTISGTIIVVWQELGDL